MTNIIPFTPQDDLQKDINRLRVEISMKFLERDDLILQQCPAIESAYLLRFGALEYKVIDAEYKWRRLRRKLQILIAARNRQENIDEKKIEDLLDTEFQAYKEKLEEKIQDINTAFDWSKRDILTEKEAKLLKTMYRKIVKLLHPDLNPNLTEAQRELFFRAVEAYEEGNLVKLEFIYDMIDNLDESVNNATSLLQEKQRLEEILQSLKDSIESIKNSFPYKFKTILADEEACLAREEQLKSELRILDQEIERYQKELERYV